MRTEARYVQPNNNHRKWNFRKLMKGQKKGKLTLEYGFLLNGFSFTLSKNRNNFKSLPHHSHENRNIKLNRWESYNKMI